MKVWRAADQTERAEWVRTWQASPGREPFAHPSFSELFARARDRVVCLSDPGEGGVELLPLVIRPLAEETWARPNEGAEDATSPYGYGGPDLRAGATGSSQEFWRDVDEWARGERIVSSFLRLSLFPEERGEVPWDVREPAMNVVRPLDVSEDSIWMDYAHKVRKNVKAATRAGLSVEMDEDGSRLEEFLGIYRSTMDRRGAADSYGFGRAFFEAIIRSLPGSFVFCHVKRAGRVVSSELILLAEKHMYSFLGGTLAEEFEHRPNDLLKHEAALWGRARGKRDFVLGGGYERGDGIYRYKLGFSPKGEVPFRVATRVHSPAEYRRLLVLRREHAASAGQLWEAKPGYFPEYRG